MKTNMKRSKEKSTSGIFGKKFITSIIFIIFLISFSAENLIVSYKPLIEAYNNQKKASASVKDTISSVQYAMEDNVWMKYKFVDTYSYVQRLMFKNEESNFEVVKDKDGILHYTYFADQANPVYELARRTEAFKNGIKGKNVKFAYIMPPDKYIAGKTQFPTGIPYNYVNETTDKFLDILKEKNIDTIDLRKNLDKSGIPADKLFYRTDHHWQIPTVFWEFGQLVNTFDKKYSLNLDPNNFYTDKNNYNFITYKDAFAGSMARKTGITYSGDDDFILAYPKFKTSYNYYSKTGKLIFNMNGRFEEVLLTTSPFSSKYKEYDTEGDKYSMYLLGNQGITHITNKNNPNGPKMLFVKDSLTVPLAAFLSTVCSDVYLVDPRYYSGSIPKFVNSVKVNYVFISYSPQDLSTDFFNFYEKK
ncbi:hypothetical protein BJV85_002431 [Clostridium acetobutylicum]|uniref:Predicted membrane protein n=2 Tax=Clostridium acetobutylicum TaxID=1488 RepID=Q97IS5_CLOAB|nr:MULTISPECIES: membrane protein [Clostridium]AAK79532.1 Predicted membrane protein [Clostridium acetobutylicum ATCC 824]ADZ20617.1 membrane protein [Clostridium acetobutylicum EA 2018]AEI31872.1 hypothetical protein SMB_G1590 [Clostridium acetobutylicum DSM 1731]AWV81224.1 hypothetical protein DK921_14215 [Clostridium acetobutylicum]MBC2392856.1 hypothetical protein [Clostridium acetobutylicum]